MDLHLKVKGVDVNVGEAAKLGSALMKKASSSPGCLGIYIEDNFIKYAKVQKDRDNIKIESFGTKFFDNLDQVISQIINETGSQKSPIAVNLPGGYYDYFELFALLNASAMRKSVDIEFEMLCADKGIDKNDMEKRYIFLLDPDDADKMKVLNVSLMKNDLNELKDRFSDYSLTTIEPLPVAITNLINVNEEDNELIVNLEKTTTITFMQNGRIDKIDTLDTSIMEAFDKIMTVENSREKAYEIMKNTTITSQEMAGTEGNEYLEVVVPVLFKILNEIKEKINEYGKQIHKVYFTGTGIVINNVDMYFQDRFNDIQCDIVKPSFIDSQSLKIGIKEYIEVNSAISMALCGLGIGSSGELNFGSKNSPLKLGKLDLSKNAVIGSRPIDYHIDAFEKMAVRVAVLCIIIIIAYAAISKYLMQDMIDRQTTAEEYLAASIEDVKTIESDKASVDYMKAEYDNLISRLNNMLIVEGEAVFGENEISTFLHRVGNTIPQEVKLVRIENTQGRHFVIEARAAKYQQLGYFKSILRTSNALENVKASTGVRYYDEDIKEWYVLVTIEGDMPKDITNLIY